MKRKKLSELSSLITKGTTPTSLGGQYASSGIHFLRVENIDAGEIVLDKTTLRIDKDTDEMLKRSRIQGNDVLISIAGTIGKSAVVPVDSPAMNCNQALAIVRTKPDLLPEFLSLWLKTPDAKAQMSNGKVTATIANLSLACIGDLNVPHPSITEQRQIVRDFGKAKRLERLVSYRQEQLNKLVHSIFLKMFGDPFLNPKGYQLAKLSELGELDRGRSRNRPRNAPHLYGGPYPFIQTGDVARASGYIRNYKQTYSEAGLAQSKLWPAGTLCITIAANIGKTAILTFPACFPDSIVGFSPTGETRTEYVKCWLELVQNHLEKNAPESAQKNINLEILEELIIPVPSGAEQIAFAEIIDNLDRVMVRVRESERQIALLLERSLQTAFAKHSSEALVTK